MANLGETETWMSNFAGRNEPKGGLLSELKAESMQPVNTMDSSCAVSKHILSEKAPAQSRGFPYSHLKHSVFWRNHFLAVTFVLSRYHIALARQTDE